MEFKAKFGSLQKRVEDALDRLLPAAQTRPARIHEAMRHSLQAGGKRLRPTLVVAASELFEGALDPLPAAAAIECVHTYSLIHDDLPAMDDADLRRGRPTCHKQFDEATAILAGDALLTYAFQLLARHYAAEPALCVALVSELAEAAGSARLIGGQMEDILGEGAALDEAQLDYIHQNKTSAMIEASLALGAVVGRASPGELSKLRQYGRHIGLAFQIMDDILDATSDAATLGKNPSDAALLKTTYVSLHGLERARAFAAEQTRAAVEICAALPGDTAFLADLARYLGERRH